MEKYVTKFETELRDEDTIMTAGTSFTELPQTVSILGRQ